MAKIYCTLDEDEMLQILSGNQEEIFRQLLEKSINCLLKAESEEQLKAAPYERTKERTDSRNGTRERELTTRIGKIELQVPRHRNQPFKTMIFENYERSEAALITTMAEMVVAGVSTRKVSQVMETLCGTSFSKSTVSEVCKELDKEVAVFRSRPITKNYPFLAFDATYFKVRENHRIVSKALMIAIGTDETGHNEVLGFDVYEKENKENWLNFVRNLKKRGLRKGLMITSDSHEGIINAVTKEFPDIPWQRCQFHFSKNITDKVCKKYQAGVSSELVEMFNAETIEEARRKRDSIINDYQDVAEEAMKCLDEGFDSAMTVMVLPGKMRTYFRTTNHIERINRELKRRSKVIGIFPNPASIIRLMGSVLIDLNEKMQEKKAMYSKETYNTVVRSDAPLKLLKIAEIQRELFIA